MCMSAIPAHMYTVFMKVRRVQGELLQLRFLVLNLHVSMGNETGVVVKSIKSPQPLSHPHSSLLFVLAYAKYKKQTFLGLQN